MKTEEIRKKILDFFDVKSLSELRCYIDSVGNNPDVEIFKKEDIIKTYTSYNDFMMHGHNWEIKTDKIISLSEYGNYRGIGNEFNFYEFLKFAKENIQHFDKFKDL